MKRTHIAITVKDLDASIVEYTSRFDTQPSCIVKNKWALWLTRELNFSIECKPDQPGVIKHIGFEDPEAEYMSRQTDINGLEWEQFSLQQQKDLVVKLWPNAQFFDE